jgi:hypothetical protein
MGNERSSLTRMQSPIKVAMEQCGIVGLGMETKKMSVMDIGKVGHVCENILREVNMYK